MCLRLIAETDARSVDVSHLSCIILCLPKMICRNGSRASDSMFLFIDFVRVTNCFYDYDYDISTFSPPSLLLSDSTWWDDVKQDAWRGRVQGNRLTQVCVKGWLLNLHECVAKRHIVIYTTAHTNYQILALNSFDYVDTFIYLTVSFY